MHSLLRSRVTSASSSRVFDVVVVGAGIAGLAFTLRLPEHLRVALLTKGALGESNTRYAQGGLAAAVSPTDSPDLHFEDTMKSGAGLCDAEAVRLLVDGGPAAVRWLLDQGTTFDWEENQLALGLEAAHSRHRVLHAGGDATGFEIERSLVQQVRDRTGIQLFEHATAVDLLKSDEAVAGVTVLLDGESEPVRFNAGLTVLANGGAGQVWAVSSNPLGATGDGIAMALRAGVAVADLEFTQFHPTVFCAENAEPFLMTEAIRGEGGYLRNAREERFMVDEHPLAELAPRDVVARAVQKQMAADKRDYVWLDVRHLDPDLIRMRFPTIIQHLAEFGFDLTQDLIPVAPAAHYFIGGIVADGTGRTSAAGLLAIGEASCTGVHGANRLASNSLLEGLVFGLAAADRITREGLPRTVASREESHSGTLLDTEALERVQRIMSDHVAVLRSRDSLEAAAAELGQISVANPGSITREANEIRNVLLLATEIVQSALMREESRGAHYRADFPEPVAKLDGQHQILENTGRRFGNLESSIQPTLPAML